MNTWMIGKIEKTTLPKKEDLHSHLNVEGIANADYIHTKRACQDFEIKVLNKYHDLYVQSNTLFLSNVFEKF